MSAGLGELRQQYVEQIRRGGATLTDELAAAFASVPREAFVTGGFQRRAGDWVKPGDPDFLATVYRDDVLVTKVDDRIPVSSSSQPSLMAIMLGALDVRPGMRVLEIGAGTGYNAALLATLGARGDQHRRAGRRRGPGPVRAGTRPRSRGYASRPATATRAYPGSSSIG